MPGISISLDAQTIVALDRYAESIGKTRSEVIQEAIEKLLKKYE